MERLFNLDAQLLLDMALTAAGVFVLFTVLSYILFVPVRGLLETRRKGLETEREQTRKKKEEAKRYLEQSQAKWKHTDTQISEVLREARENARVQEQKGRAEGKQAAERLLQQAQKEAAQEWENRQEEMKREMISLAVEMAEKIVAVQLDEGEQDRLFQETLKEIGETTWQDSSQEFMQKPGMKRR